jgi:hypothetical protein
MHIAFTGFTNAGSNQWIPPDGAKYYCVDKPNAVLTRSAGNACASWIAGLAGSRICWMAAEHACPV